MEENEGGGGGTWTETYSNIWWALASWGGQYLPSQEATPATPTSCLSKPSPSPPSSSAPLPPPPFPSSTSPASTRWKTSLKWVQI